MSVDQYWGLVWVFHSNINVRHYCWRIFLCFKLAAANLVNNTNDMQVFKIIISCMDTTGPLTIYFITCLQDMDLIALCLHTDQFIPILVAIALVWIATKQTVGNNAKKICLLHVIGFIGAPSFPHIWSYVYTTNLIIVINQSIYPFYIVVSNKKWIHFTNCTV